MQPQYYYPFYPYDQYPLPQNLYRNDFGNEMGNAYGNDERFFPFFPLLLPLSFVAGLAVGPLLFNNRPPYPPPYPPYPPAYPPYPAYQGNPGYPGYQGFQGFQGYPQQFGAQAAVNENINIYTQ